MQKKVNSKSLLGLSVFQIYLLLTFTFAISFFISQSEIVSAVGAAPAALPVAGSTGTVAGGGVLGAIGLGAPLGLGAAGAVGGQTALLGIKATATSSYALGGLYAGISYAVIWAGLVYGVARLFGADGPTATALAGAVAAGIIAYNIGAGLATSAALSSAGLSAGTISAALSAGSGQAAAAIITAGVPNTAAGVAVVNSLPTGAALAGATPSSVVGAAQGAALTATPPSGIGAALLNPFVIGAIVLVVFILLYKKVKQELITFQCLPWEAPLGGSKCEVCNSDPLRPCSEYRCRALGQGCELVNENSDRPQCVWINKGDTTSPTIVEWTEALKPTNLQYTPNNALRPGARGVKIVDPTSPDGCLPAYTALQFGVLTNEPAQCKIDYNRSISFDNMQYYLGGSNYYEYNHSQLMRLPNVNDENIDLSPVLQNDGSFALFLRCRDSNGNVNEDEYSINYCVAAGPDTSPPIIEGSSLESGSAVQSGADLVTIEVYTNEPAQCRWSSNDRAYKDMEHEMGCVQDPSQVNANLQYSCVGVLEGIKNNQENDFYFRCQDQPTAPESQRNTMTQSYKLTLRGTEPLSILEVRPNSTTITASTNSVAVDLFVETDDGADNGEAICYFSETGETGSFIEFYETNAIEHRQTLSLAQGDYGLTIKCIDSGGNAASSEIEFSTKVDKNIPVVTRVYKKGTDALQLITNEEAQCYYSRTSCNFEIAEGLIFNNPSPDQTKAHLTSWKDNSPYYIKCRDPYGNAPSPNACSIIVSGIDLSVQAAA